jgi:release factor glutamine methyltransferase
MVKRRGQREPLQHILGSTSFCGLELAVNRSALVPRPETEQLAEFAWQHLHALVAGGNSASKVLDFGTGTGCLAIAIAVKVPGARVTAIDVSEEALELARANAARHNVSDCIQFLHGQGFSAVPQEARFDLIVSNPPYIPTAEIESLEPEVRDFDPRVALDGGVDGLDCYRLLSREADGFLKPDGLLMMEIGDGQAEAVSELFTGQMWIVEAVREDYSGRQRFVTVRKSG